MPWFWDANNKVWLIVGLALIGSVGGLILYLNACAEPVMETPHLGERFGVEYAQTFVLAGTPEWVHSAYLVNSEKMPEKYRLPAMSPNELPMVGTLCERDGEVYPCVPGSILIVPLDARTANCTAAACEGGRARFDLSSMPPHCTIFVPRDALDLQPLDLIGELDQPQLPVGVLDMILSHEAVHCYRGDGHITTPLFGPVSASPSGHIMAASAFRLGWKTEGL